MRQYTLSIVIKNVSFRFLRQYFEQELLKIGISEIGSYYELSAFQFNLFLWCGLVKIFGLHVFFAISFT